MQVYLSFLRDESLTILMFMKFVRKRNLRSLFLKTILAILLLLRVARNLGSISGMFRATLKSLITHRLFPIDKGRAFNENTNRAYAKWYEKVLIDILNDSHFDYPSYFPMFCSPLNYCLADIWEHIMCIMLNPNSSIFS